MVASTLMPPAKVRLRDNPLRSFVRLNAAGIEALEARVLFDVCWSNTTGDNNWFTSDNWGGPGCNHPDSLRAGQINIDANILISSNYPSESQRNVVCA